MPADRSEIAHCEAGRQCEQARAQHKTAQDDEGKSGWRGDARQWGGLRVCQFARGTRDVGPRHSSLGWSFRRHGGASREKASIKPQGLDCVICLLGQEGRESEKAGNCWIAVSYDVIQSSYSIQNSRRFNILALNTCFRIYLQRGTS